MTVRIEKPAFNLREKLTELDVPVGNSGSQLMRADTVREAFEHIQAGRKNLIQNGDMRIAQRATTKDITGNGYHTVDRWEAVGNSNMSFDVTMSRQSHANTPYMPHRNSVKFLTNTAQNPSGSENFILRQRIEAADFGAMSRWGMDNAQWLTVSFWVKSNKPGIYSFQAYVGMTGSNADCLQAYTIDSRDVWEYKVLHIPPVGKNASAWELYTGHEWGLMVDWHLSDSPNDEIYPHGWSTTSGGAARCVRGQSNILSAVGNYIEFTGIQIEAGRQATPFEYRTLADEMRLCRRYYTQYGPNSALGRFPMMGECTGASVAQYPLQFPVPMRGGSGGVSLTTNGSASDYQIYSANSSKPCSSISLAVTFKNDDGSGDIWGVRINMNRDAGDLSAGHAAQAYSGESTSILGFSREF